MSIKKETAEGTKKALRAAELLSEKATKERHPEETKIVITILVDVRVYP